jgi:hypothetical protein
MTPIIFGEPFTQQLLSVSSDEAKSGSHEFCTLAARIKCFAGTVEHWDLN